jgi:hypothetical protein
MINRQPQITLFSQRDRNWNPTDWPHARLAEHKDWIRGKTLIAKVNQGK